MALLPIVSELTAPYIVEADFTTVFDRQNESFTGYMAALKKAAVGYVLEGNQYYRLVGAIESTQYASMRYRSTTSVNTFDASFLDDNGIYYGSWQASITLDGNYQLKTNMTVYSSRSEAIEGIKNELLGTLIYPISYYEIHSNLTGPSEATAGEEVTVDVSFPDGYKLKNATQGSGIMVYNDDGYINYTYDEATNKLKFTMPE